MLVLRSVRASGAPYLDETTLDIKNYLCMSLGLSLSSQSPRIHWSYKTKNEKIK